jgi:hypothetical protein
MVPSINNQKIKKLELCCGESSRQDHITNSRLLAQFHSQGSAVAGTRHSTHTQVRPCKADMLVLLLACSVAAGHACMEVDGVVMHVRSSAGSESEHHHNNLSDPATGGEAGKD